MKTEKKYDRFVVKIVKVERAEGKFTKNSLIKLTLQNTRVPSHRVHDTLVLIPQAEWKTAQLLKAAGLLDPDHPDWLKFDMTELIGKRVRLYMKLNPHYGWVVLAYEKPGTRYV